MIDFFDTYYSSLKKRNKMHSLLRYTIRQVSNFLLPSYMKLTRKKVLLPKMESEQIIVSITSFPKRISKIWIVIECVLRQERLPSKIILWLSKEQFPNEMDDLPKNLLGYFGRNQLEIIFVDDDLRSHKKYYYAFKMFPNDIIITLDDDLYYSSNTIRDLLDLHKKHPDTLCCLRGHRIVRSDKKILPYSKWHKLSGEYGPAMDIFHTSGGGTLYKSTMFTSEVLNDKVFRELCFFADDVWLNFMLQLNNTPSVKSEFTTHLIPILNNSIKLSRQNVTEGGNDKQLFSLIDYYKVNEENIFV